MEGSAGDLESRAETWRIARGNATEAGLFLKLPAGYGFGEIFSVLVLAEGDLGLDTKHAAVGSHEKRFDIAAILAIVNLCDLLPDGMIFDFFSEAFEDYGFVGFFGANHAVRFGGDVFCLA